jgi:hypothetical protein
MASANRLETALVGGPTIAFRVQALDLPRAALAVAHQGDIGEVVG